MMTRLQAGGAENGDSIPDGGGDFFLCYLAKTSSGTYPVSYPMGNGGCFARAKRSERPADASPLSSAKSHERPVLYFHSPICHRIAVLNYESVGHSSYLK
jgi:hypothetical protein